MPSDQPILLTPDREGYLLRGATKLGALLFGDAVFSGSAKMASPRGFARVISAFVGRIAVPLTARLPAA